MAGKIKMTPFSRFFLMFIILAPLAYIGASYYNGEDPIQNIKNFFHVTDAPSDSSDKSAADNSALLEQQLEACRREKDLLNRRIGELEQMLQDAKAAGK